MVQYDDEMLQEINDNVNLLDYVSQTLEMKRRGSDYFSRCPLHVDITPSFSINPNQNSYYCFSCGRGGGIIGYLMEYEHLSFDKAVAKASGLANVDLSKMCQSQTALFLRKLKKAKSQKNESVSHTILNPNILKKYRKASIQEWINEGIRQVDLDLYEVMYDDIGHRIVYPVYDLKGNLINIKGRTLFSDYKKMGIPKYINYYKVGIMDYFQGLNIALKDIQQEGEVIVFESIKSVMKLRSFGRNNSVSAEKHSLTKEQIELLIKLRVNVVFAYDSDVSYKDREVKRNINTLKKFTNVFIIEDKNQLLGGKEAKNSPVDIDKATWEQLYTTRKRVA